MSTEPEKINVLDFTNQIAPNHADTNGNALPITWRELRDAIQKLPEEFIDNRVIGWGSDGAAVPVYGVIEITQDLINPSGDGAEPRAAYIGPHRVDIDQDEDDYVDEPIVFRKGCFVLDCNWS